MQWISDTAVVYPFGFATPLSACLIMRHYCRVISKRHRCRSDIDLATPLSGGCSVSAVIQSKTYDSVVGCIALWQSCHKADCYPLTDRTKVTTVWLLKTDTAVAFHFSESETSHRWYFSLPIFPSSEQASFCILCCRCRSDRWRRSGSGCAIFTKRARGFLLRSQLFISCLFLVWMFCKQSFIARDWEV